MALTARRLDVRTDGPEDLEAAAGEDPFAAEVVVSTAAWERWNAGAVWCSLEGLTTDRHVLRVAVSRPYGVLEIETGDATRERAVVPATAAPGYFWRACGLRSSSPCPPPDLDDVACVGAVNAWAQGLEPDGDRLPRALRLRVGDGEQVLQHAYLLDGGSGWMRGQRLVLGEEPTITIEEFSMKRLVLDLSALLSRALAGAPLRRES